MTEKDYALYGTKVLNLKTQEIGLLICIWKNKFADVEVDVLDYSGCRKVLSFPTPYGLGSLLLTRRPTENPLRDLR